MSQASITGHLEGAGQRTASEDLGDLSASAGILIGSAISLIMWQLLLLALYLALT